MDVNINLNYEVVVSEDVNIPSSYLKEYLSYLDFYSKEDLGEGILDYMDYEFDPEIYIKDKELGQIITVNVLNMDVLNMDDLIEHFSYLIKELPEEIEEKSNVCLHCTYESGNYCSNCGKKLK